MRWQWYIPLAGMGVSIDTWLTPLFPLYYCSLLLLVVLVRIRDERGVIVLLLAGAISRYWYAGTADLLVWCIASLVCIGMAQRRYILVRSNEFRACILFVCSWHVTWLIYWMVIRGVSTFLFTQWIISVLIMSSIYSFFFVLTHRNEHIRLS